MTTETRIAFIECPSGRWTAQLSDKRRFSHSDSQVVKEWAILGAPSDAVRIRQLFAQAGRYLSTVGDAIRKTTPATAQGG